MATGFDGKEVMFTLMGPGEVIGEIPLLDGGERSASVVAVEPTELLTLHRRELIPFLESHPGAAIGLAGVLAARVRRLSERTEDRQTMPLPGRIAKRLIALSKQYGKHPIAEDPSRFDCRNTISRIWSEPHARASISSYAPGKTRGSLKSVAAVSS